MKFRFIPEEVKFFDLFDQLASKILISAKTFHELAIEAKFDE